MASVVFVQRGENYHAVDEIFGLLDTPNLIETLKSRYKDHSITIYPDASGASRKTVNASESDLSLLRQAKFTVRANNKNPAVRDRILSMNTSFEKARLFVNITRCKEFTRCLEQQAYTENGEPDKTAGFDHMNDAGGYFVCYEMPVRKPVANIQLSF